MFQPPPIPPIVIPQSLKIVAYLFILGGIHSVLDILFSLLYGKIKIDLGVLYIFIGQGLLRLNPNSYMWAKGLTGLGMIFMPIVTLLFLMTPGNLKIFGQIVGQAPPGFGFIIGVVLTILVYWQYGVLNAPETKRLFDKRT